MKRFGNHSERRRTRAMKRVAPQVRVVAAVLMVFVLAASAATAGADRRASINRLIDESGMKQTIESFASSAREQMAAGTTELSSEDERQLLSLFQAVFATHIIRDHVVDALEQRYDPIYDAELKRWFASELGSAIRDEEIRAQTPDATSDLLEFIQASESQPPNPERLELAHRLNRARGSSELSLRLLTEILRGTVVGTSIVSNMDGQAPTVAELEAMVESQIGPLDALLEQQMVASLLYTGRNFSLADNRAYLKHIESDAGRWFYSTTGEGLVGAMMLAGRGFGIHSAAWVQDLRGNAAADNTEERRQAAAKAGHAFAASNSQSACVDEVYDRRRSCKEDACFSEARAFAEGCFATAKSDPGLCDGVPGAEDLATTIYWRLSRCDERGTPDGYCNAAVGALQDYCAAVPASP